MCGLLRRCRQVSAVEPAQHILAAAQNLVQSAGATIVATAAIVHGPEPTPVNAESNGSFPSSFVLLPHESSASVPTKEGAKFLVVPHTQVRVAEGNSCTGTARPIRLTSEIFHR
jgi:hypothetical protein